MHVFCGGMDSMWNSSESIPKVFGKYSYSAPAVEILWKSGVRVLSCIQESM